MRSIVPFLAVLLFASAANAQQLSVGAASGMSYWMQHEPANCLLRSTPEGHHLSWNKELTVRYQTSNRWAFEGGISHDALQHRYESMGYGCFGPATYNKEVWHTNVYALHLQGQYDITPGQFRHCPLLSRVRSYIGLSADPTLMAQHQEVVSTFEGGTEPMVFQSESRTFRIWVGLNHTLQFDLSKRVQLQTGFSFVMEPQQFFSSLSYYSGSYFAADSRLRSRVGLSYKL